MKSKWIVLIVIAAIATGIFLYLRIRKTNDFEPQIKAKLAKLVSDASNGLYKLDMEHVEIDITTASVTARNIILLPDSLRMIELEKSNQLGNDIYSISLKNLKLDGISPLALLNQKNINLDKLVLDSPEIKIVHTKRNFEEKDTSSLYEKIQLNGQSFSINSLLLKNIHLTVTNLDKNKSVSSFKNLSASFTDIKIDSSTLNDSSRFLFAKDAVIFLKDFKQVTGKKKYQFDVDSMALHPQNGTLQLFEIRLKPVGTKDEFNAKLSSMEDRYDIQIKKVNINNVNWFSLLSEDGFYGDDMKINGGFVKVYDDRRLPLGESKAGNFPHQMLMAVDFPISMKKVTLNNMFVSYEEFNPKSDQTGIIEFYNLTGEISNVTNIKTEINNNPIVTINASADFMNAGKLNAAFKFNLAKVKAGNFSVDASLGKMNGQSLNKITEGLALVKIKTLEIDKLVTHIEGSNMGSTGNVTFAYHDLSFDVLKSNDEGDLKKSGLLTFIVNKIIVNKSSPAKQYAVSRKYDPQRSFFNLIWKTILEGILKTVK